MNMLAIAVFHGYAPLTNPSEAALGASFSFRRTLAACVALGFALAACTSSPSSTTDTNTGSGAPVSAPPVSPTPLVVGECTIAPSTNCQDASLRLASLAGQDLHGANLSGADLYGADLRHTDLRDADLSNAVLANVDLTAARLDRANLTGAKLQSANLTNTNLINATLRNGQLSTALICGTTMPDGSVDKSGCLETQDTNPNQAPKSPTSSSPKPKGKNPPVIKTFEITPNPVVCKSKNEPDKNVKARISVKDATVFQIQIGSAPPGGEHDASQPVTAHVAFDCSQATVTYTLLVKGDGGKDSERITINRDLKKTSPN
jgi:hypothetical protein